MGPYHSADRWFAQEVLPHEPALRAWLQSQFPRLADVNDVIHDAYARVWRAHGAGRIDNPKAFLFTTARNIALDHFRREQVVGFEPIAEIEQLPVMENGPGLSETVCRNQELELLTQAIQSLPERCRQVLTLRKIYGLSQKEIAVQLGISEHTVEAQVGNGMRRCAEFLARHGLP